MSITVTDAAQLLLNRQLVAFPTETVYGLGACANAEEAVEKIYALKGRPAHNPLICHVLNADRAAQFAELSSEAYALTKAFWPGPLTLIVPLKDPSFVCSKARANLNTVGIRCPDHPIALELLKHVDVPLVAPSANLSNQVSPTRSAHVRDHFPELPILEGGSCQTGVESTILDVTGSTPLILRPGGISAQDIERVLNKPVIYKTTHNTITAPGQLQVHYAPKVPLYMDITTPHPEEIYVGFGDMVCDINLSPSGDLKEAAQNLFHTLRTLEKNGQPISIAPIPNTGIGRAINDRLQRAATKRDSSE